MIYNYEVNTEDFQRAFEDKFSNFCKKAPVVLSFTTERNSVSVYLHPNPENPAYRKRVLTQEFDYSRTLKENIFSIRKYLTANHYPRLLQEDVYEEPRTPQELNTLVERGEISLDDIGTDGLLRSEKIWWRVEKVVVMKDNLLVRNLNTGQLGFYRTRMPVVVLLKKLNSSRDPEWSWNLFEKKTVFLKSLYEDPETRKELWGNDENKGGTDDEAR